MCADNVKPPHVLIVCPGHPLAHNGNWQTAHRWQRLLRPIVQTSILERWQGESADVLLALHARRSAASVLDWARERGGQCLALVLTGTDLYRDIATDPQADAALQAAGQLVVLQERGVAALPPMFRHKAQVIYQSTPRWQTLSKTDRRLRALMVGHLRDEKDPWTFWRAASGLAGRADIMLDHVGAALEPELGLAARKAANEFPAYRWLAGLTHAQARARIARAHVLVHPSKMEGGAHVIMEAVQSATPVLASRVDGNVGMLGENYAGYFAQGDDAALASLLLRCRDDDAFLPLLQQQCQARAHLFDPTLEQQSLRHLVDAMLGHGPEQR